MNGIVIYWIGCNVRRKEGRAVTVCEIFRSPSSD